MVEGCRGEEFRVEGSRHARVSRVQGSVVLAGAWGLGVQDLLPKPTKCRNS